MGHIEQLRRERNRRNDGDGRRNDGDGKRNGTLPLSVVSYLRSMVNEHVRKCSVLSTTRTNAC